MMSEETARIRRCRPTNIRMTKGRTLIKVLSWKAQDCLVADAQHEQNGHKRDAHGDASLVSRGHNPELTQSSSGADAMSRFALCRQIALRNEPHANTRLVAVDTLGPAGSATRVSCPGGGGGARLDMVQRSGGRRGRIVVGIFAWTSYMRLVCIFHTAALRQWRLSFAT
ncbi:hypothetical protein GY45DRAFT_282034 [Cubamyces sp. BRFM 1775]|nr:hypothetical protein GY45DRAFT_282034 [Cubamyces sp. BRFM 1775]